ncbi:hypothetical protein I4U23_006456 [Adineta vaga]|nr:hypothetical protein I4U23_006456 [Adineta vaga]
MFRLKTVSSLLFYGAAALVSLVFVLHLFTPSYRIIDDESDPSYHDDFNSQFSRVQSQKQTVQPPTSPLTESTTKEINTTMIECRDKLLTIEQYRTRSVVRGVIVRFPSRRTEYYFVQFRWFFRSWIESEMFTLDRWRTDIIILIDNDFDNDTRQFLEHLNCRLENQRTTRRQTSRCILVLHQTFSQRSESERQTYIKKYPALNGNKELDNNIDRIFAIHSYINQLNKIETLYDILMITTMNTFLTTQFGKYIPVKCAFVIGTEPDYSTWYGQIEQIQEFVHTLLTTLKGSTTESGNLTMDFKLTIETLQPRFLFLQKQVDIPCDSTRTTYRTYIYHLKCYAHSTSLFSEKMFRQNAYDGYEKEPFNIYIAREYATLIALQSKVMSLDDLHSLSVNVTRREVFS